MIDAILSYTIGTLVLLLVIDAVIMMAKNENRFKARCFRWALRQLVGAICFLGRLAGAMLQQVFAKRQTAHRH